MKTNRALWIDFYKNLLCVPVNVSDSMAGDGAGLTKMEQTIGI